MEQHATKLLGTSRPRRVTWADGWNTGSGHHPESRSTVAGDSAGCSLLTAPNGLGSGHHPGSRSTVASDSEECSSLTAPNGRGSGHHPESWSMVLAGDSEECSSLTAPNGLGSGHHPESWSTVLAGDSAECSSLTAPNKLDSGAMPSMGTRIAMVLDWTPPQTSRSEFSFRWSDLAARTNLEILRRHDMNIHRALQDQPFCGLSFGSEFRPPELLGLLCGNHPLWDRVTRWLTSGVEFPLAPISDEDQQADIAATLARGNHKSAQAHDEQVQSMFRDEVARGWQLILPLSAAHLIPGAELTPVGIVEQDTINDRGEVVQKWRLTHDQSFNVVRASSRSVNDNVKSDEPTPCAYGHALLHIHKIVGLRQRHPTARILQTKVDWKSAYRHLHYSAAEAVRAMVAVGGFLLVALRLTFGGAPNPGIWNDVSEVACDLANDMVRDDTWDHVSQVSPHQHLIGDRVLFEPDSVPFAPVAATSMDLPTDDNPTADCYIDDLFRAYLEHDNARASRVIPFVVHLFPRPLASLESLPRDNMLSLTKFLGEATPAECLIILGWLLDTRRLLVSLPPGKHRGVRSIQDMLAADQVFYKELEILIGRCNHAGVIIPMSRHFLGRLRQAMYAANKKRGIRLSAEQRADLRLWILFLDQAAAGISMNLINLRRPNRILRSDACEHGIGGMSATSGIAWRWEIPFELRHRLTLN